MEIYDGVKFETVFAHKRPPVAAASDELVAWVHRFVASGLASAGEDASGNLSLRLGDGFLITPTHVPMSSLESDDLVHVLEAGERVTVIGTREPSSEVRLHAALYDARPDIHAIFHGHEDSIVARGASLGVATTAREVSYGSPELAELAVEVGKAHDVFVLHSHGFVALGRTADEAGAAALGALHAVREGSGS